MTQGYGKITPKWLIPLIVLGILALMFGSQSMNGFGGSSPLQPSGSGNGLDPNPAPNNAPANSNVPVVTTTPEKTGVLITATPTPQKAKLQLQETYGPFALPTYGSKLETGAFEFQKIYIEFNNGRKGFATANSMRSFSATAGSIDYRSSNKPTTVYIKVYDKEGRNFYCKKDEGTGECYYLKVSITENGALIEDKAGVMSEELAKKTIKWEVLAYSS